MNLFDDFFWFCMTEDELDDGIKADDDYSWVDEALKEEECELKKPISKTVNVNNECTSKPLDLEALIYKAKEAAFGKHRKYYAEAELQKLQWKQLNGIESEFDRATWDLCKFILESDAIAAKYLTVENGFIYSQAIRENFTLPIEIPKEDRKSEIGFFDIFMKIIEIDMKLAVDIWVWCIKIFGPYAHFMEDKYDLYMGVDYHVNEYPPEFMDYATEIMCTDIEFSQQYFGNTTHTLGSHRYITHALEMGHYEGAAEIERIARANPYLKDHEVEIFENLIRRAHTDFPNLLKL